MFLCYGLQECCQVSLSLQVWPEYTKQCSVVVFFMLFFYANTEAAFALFAHLEIFLYANLHAALFSWFDQKLSPAKTHKLQHQGLIGQKCSHCSVTFFWAMFWTIRACGISRKVDIYDPPPPPILCCPQAIDLERKGQPSGWNSL